MSGDQHSKIDPFQYPLVIQVKLSELLFRIFFYYSYKNTRVGSSISQLVSPNSLLLLLLYNKPWIIMHFTSIVILSVVVRATFAIPILPQSESEQGYGSLYLLTSQSVLFLIEAMYHF